MAHPEQGNFFERLKQGFPQAFAEARNILEVGSQDINGSVRPLFSSEATYIGIDLGIAKGVDWVIPGELIELPDGWADLVISTECFEHCDQWPRVFKNMLRIVAPSGLVIITAAATGRATHGTLDSDEASSPFTSSYYRNLDIDLVAEQIKLGDYFDRHGFELNSRCGDLYFWGQRSLIPFADIDQHWQSPLDRLARAQGQLAQAALRHNEVLAQAQAARDETERLRQELATAHAATQQANATLQQQQELFEQLQQEREESRLQSQRLMQGLESSQRELAAIRLELDQADAKLQHCHAQLSHAQRDAEQAEREAEQASLRIDQLESALAAVEATSNPQQEVGRMRRLLRRGRRRLLRLPF